MKLLELKIRNFKGIKEFDFSPQGKNTSIFGQNGTGKTTIADAFRWLLFGKDTKDRADFSIKEISNNGNESGIDHEVYAKIEISDKPIELKRIFKEKWTKKHGSPEREFTGHTTDYYIDSVPIKEKEYKERISAIIDEKKFKMLIDPFYFAEKISWQERRSILFDICKDLPSDLEIINTKRDLSEITEFLNGNSIDDYKKIIKSKKKDINKELNEIPTRIDEANRALIDIDSKIESDIKIKTENLKKNRIQKLEKKMMLENDKGTIDKKAELAEVRQQISKFVQDYEKKNDEEIREKKEDLKELENKYDAINSLETRQNNSYKIIDNEIDEIESEIIKLRQLWHNENDKEFSYEKKTKCFACNQDLPKKQIEENYNKALEQFNKEKSEKLEDIQNKGKKLKASRDILIKDKEKLEKEIQAFKNDKEQINKKCIAIEKQIQNIKEKRDKYIREKEFLALAQKEIQLTGQLEKLISGDKKESIDIINKEIEEIDKIIDELENDLLRIAQNKTQIKRIEALKKEQKDLAEEYQKFEKQLYLLDQFTRIKVDLIESQINNQFKLSSFKLFNQLVNGEIEDCCEVTDKTGVPFISNLNKGAQRNIGLDIINTLSEYWNMDAPIFIDDAEGITNIIETKGQQIRLYVQANQETLRVLID